ncbi:Peptide chain release factor N(5)-glutamine methyltransferase [hydrothermal vent metagenome]|uniref:peptide chain release factor N(5)-glutamine methyltransferase n=1 Tax=hydrothermal vent metagenome TaxID=652676 RepID=A0A3B0SEY6_9ZZZZ
MNPNWHDLSFIALSRRISQQLSGAGIEEAEQETRWLLEKNFGTDVWQKLIEPEQKPDADALPELASQVARRLAGEPLSHILGNKGFWSLDLQINADVLTPRADSETLVAVALRLSQNQPTGRILDLGTGSGAVLLAFLSERANWHGVGVDISAPALQIANTNAQTNGLAKRSHFIHANWNDLASKPYDLVISNPPYIASAEIETLQLEVRAFEPRIALDGGEDGLDAYRSLAKKLPDWLKPGSPFAFEIGHSQAKTVTEILQQTAICTELTTDKDLANRDRVVSGRLCRA